MRQVRHSGAKFKRHKKLSNQKKNKVNEIFLRAELMQKIHDKQNIKILKTGSISAVMNDMGD